MFAIGEQNEIQTTSQKITAEPGLLADFILTGRLPLTYPNFRETDEITPVAPNSCEQIPRVNEIKSMNWKSLEAESLPLFISVG